MLKLSKILPFGLILLAPFINFLRFNDYGYWHAEVLIISFGLISLGLITAVIYTFGNWTVKSLIFAVTVTLALSFFPGWQSILVLILTFLSALLVNMLVGAKNFSPIFTIVVSVFLLGILFLPMHKQFSDSVEWQRAEQPINKNLPNIIYLILDEHAGIEALPTLKPALQKFYQGAGFKLYGNAYSHYPITYDSIPNLLNFTTNAQDDSYFSDPLHRTLKQNLFFSLLTKKGYQLRIYQPDFINYCNATGADVTACYTYPSLSIKKIANLNLCLQERTNFVLKSFLLQSAVYQIALHLYQFELRPWVAHWGWNLPNWPWYQARVSTLSMLDEFARLQTDLPLHPAGTVFFAHLLAPHNPYIYDADCKLIPSKDWQINRGPSPQVNTPLLRAERYKLYEGQVACVQKQMQLIFNTLQQAGIYNQTMIIVHGDHGSRIGLHHPTPSRINQLTQQDFKDYYVTLFAAKLPGQVAGYDQSLLDLQSLLASLMPAISGDNIPYTPTKAFVYLYPAKIGASLSSKNIDQFKAGSS